MNDSTRIHLEGTGHVDVDAQPAQVDLTITAGGRARMGLTLSPAEARDLAAALIAAASA